MDGMQPLGRSELVVPRLGLGVMTWGEATGLSRFHPAKICLLYTSLRSKRVVVADQGWTDGHTVRRAV